MVNKTETLVACIQELARRYVIGLDPFDSHLLAQRIQRDDYGRPGEVTQSALSSFDVACLDLVGQQLGVPVWKLLGGCVRDRIPAYANGWYRTDRTPEAFADAADAVVARGYRALKLDPFGSARAVLTNAERRAAVDLAGAVRDSIGPDIDLYIEMHGRFNPMEAVRVAGALAEMSPGWLEEPVPPENARALAQVRAGTRLPIATGERAHTLSEVRELLENGLVDVLQCDITHFGGLTAIRALSHWADVYCVDLAPHNVCGPVGTMAAIHAAVSLPNLRIVEHFNDFADPWVQDLVDTPPIIGNDGCFGAPQLPGLGVRLDHSRCREHPATGGRLRLFESGWERRGSA